MSATAPAPPAPPEPEPVVDPGAALPAGPRLPGFAQTALYGLIPYNFFALAKRRFGTMFTVRLMGETWVVLTEPEAVRDLFAQGPSAVDAGAANGPLRPIIGQRNIFFLDGREHLDRRRLVLGPLHGAPLRGHADRIAAIIADGLSRWPAGEAFPTLPSMRRFTFDVMTEVVFGPHADDAGVREVRERLWDVVSWGVAMRRSIVYAVGGPDRFMALPGYAKHVAALDRAVYAEIARRRARDRHAQAGDCLSMLLAAATADGTPLSDHDVRDEVVSLILAGHETTTGLLAWAVHEVARSPATQARLRAREPGFAERVVMETLRLHPPAHLTALRRLREPLTLGGHRLPAGVTVALTPVVVQRRDDLYDDARAFRPDRIDGRPPSAHWLPFGGGARRCLGASLAQFETHVALEAMVDRFDLRPAARRPEGLRRHGFVAVPGRGARIVVTPRAGAPADPAAEGRLRKIADDLWVLDEPLRFRGAEIGRRMVVARLASGDLWVHSPARLTPELAAELEALGPVRHVVAPSRLHGHLHMGPYRERFPDAALHAAPGLPAHRRDLWFDDVLGDAPPAAWAGDLDQRVVQGNVFGDELAFLHRASGTLIVADLCFNLRRPGLWTRLLTAGPRLRTGFGPTPGFRLALRNRAAARRSLDQVLAWPYDRVVPGHGDILERGGHAAMERAFAWL